MARSFSVTWMLWAHKLDCKHLLIFFQGGIIMSEHCHDALQCRPEDLRSALSIHTQKITDSCRDKDCIEDLRVYLTRESQAVLDSAASAKVRCAELIWTSIDVTPVAFNRNHYYIDLTFYYKIIADAMITSCRPAALCGLALFSKRAVLCGENTCAHIFRSDSPRSFCSNPAPTAVVEVLDPMVLSSRVVPACAQEPCTLQIPVGVKDSFDDELVLGGDRQRLFVTLGQFSIIRLERDAQLIVPVLDYAIPTKECCDNIGSCGEDPCELFSRIPFPATRFTPNGCTEEKSGCTECYQTCSG